MAKKTRHSQNLSPENHPDTVFAHYCRMVENKQLEEDEAQLRAIKNLDFLNQDLATRKLANKKSSLGWLFGARNSAWKDVQGLYIWGSVGRGKTMLMDLFYETSLIRRKKRVHFHEFMDDIHKRIHQHRQNAKKNQKTKRDKASTDDPIIPVANQICEEVRLLCFDEFTVRDITDAMIMRRLFTHLFMHNVVIVATSNVAPDDLYQDGLRRGDFLSFINVLKKNTTVLELNARTDFRLEKTGQHSVFLYPLDLRTLQKIDQIWQNLTKNQKPAPTLIKNKGREIMVKQATNQIARFSFEDLCEKPLGASDYLKVAEQFKTIILDDIPRFQPEKRNEAKRFINLIDALYDARITLFASAEAAPEALNNGLNNVEAFEFDRTVSRLIEMQSDSYLKVNMNE